jgi:hypothetical protein
MTNLEDSRQKLDVQAEDEPVVFPINRFPVIWMQFHHGSSKVVKRPKGHQKLL